MLFVQLSLAIYNTFSYAFLICISASHGFSVRSAPHKKKMAFKTLGLEKMHWFFVFRQWFLRLCFFCFLFLEKTAHVHTKSHANKSRSFPIILDFWWFLCAWNKRCALVVNGRSTMEANASITFEMTIFLIKSEIEIKSELAKFAVMKKLDYRKYKLCNTWR